MRKAIEVLVGSMVVYAAMAACSGGSHPGTTGRGRGAAGETVASTSGAPPTSGGGAPSAESGAATTAGGLLDPVPTAGAQEGGNGSGGAGPIFGYRRVTVPCDSDLKDINSEPIPVAILNIDPPSLTVAATTLHLSDSDRVPGWYGNRGFAYVEPNGSKVAVECFNSAPVIFFVPQF
jgi:hypothetical protein